MTEDNRAGAPSDAQSHIRESIRMLVDLDTNAPGALAQGVPEIHPRDIALVLQDFTVPEMLKIVGVLPADKAAEAILHADPLTRSAILSAFDETRLTSVVSALEPDEGADILQSIDPARKESVLCRLPDREAQVLRLLGAYDPDSAGGVMTTRFQTANADATVADALAMIRASRQAQRFDRLYAVDSDGRPLGTVPAGRLVSAADGARLREIMEPALALARVDDSKATVVAIARKHRVEAVPVVGPGGRLLGIVTADDVIDAAGDEAGDDVVGMGGTRGSHPTREPLARQVVVRVPWLLITLSGGIVAALVVGRHADLAAASVGLVCFLPAVMAMGANAGLASSAAMVRGISTGEADQSRLYRLLAREAVIAAILGILFGLAAGLVARFYLGDEIRAADIGLAIGVATAVGIVISACLATAIVLVSPRFGVRPSTVAGPLVIIVSEVACVAAYFAAATFILVNSLGGA